MVVNIEGERWGIALPAFTEDLCRLLFGENRYPWGHIAYTDCDGNTEMVPVISLQSGTYYGVSRSKATRDACWLPRFVPLKEGLEVDTQAYADLPFGFESVLGTLWVGEKKREWRGLLRKPLAYRSGTIEIREPDPDERYQIKVIKLDNAFYPKAPLLRNISWAELEAAGLTVLGSNPWKAREARRRR